MFGTRWLKNQVNALPSQIRWSVLGILLGQLLITTPGAVRAGAKDVIIFLGDANLPPFEFMAEGTPRGAVVDLVRAIGRTLGRPVEILADINRALRALKKSGEFARIVDRWSGRHIVLFEQQQIWVLSLALGLALLALVSLVVVIAVLRSRQAARRRAGELEAINSALRESEEKHRNIFDNAAAGMMRSRISDGRVLHANSRAAEIFGHDDLQRFVDEFNVIGSYVDPADRSRMLEVGFRDGVVQDFEVRFRRRGGAIVTTHVHSRFNLSANYIDAVIIDISEQKRAEEAQRESDRRFRNLVAGSLQGILVTVDNRIVYANESAGGIFGFEVEDLLVMESEARFAGMLSIAPDAIVAAGSDMRIKVFNRGAESVFGLPSEDAIGQPIDILIPARFRATHAAHIESFLNASDESRLMTERGEITGLRSDGSEFPAEASVSKLQLGADVILTVMLHDISERKQSESDLIAAKERAEYADRTKSEFLANMSHELRTPLNAILGFAQMIEGQVLGTKTVNRYIEYAHDIHDSGEHLLAIINDILDLSKIEAGKAELDEHELEIVDLVASASRLVRDRAKEWGLELSVEVCSGDTRLRADGRMLKQMLLNLLSNAIKFTPPGGRVILSAERGDDRTFRFKIIDTGVGIAPEDIPKALSQFGQVGDPRTQASDGTGLGLPLVAALAALHGGGLELESEVGAGTIATIWLPAERVIAGA